MMISNNITDNNEKYYMEVSSRFTSEYSFRIPKLFIVVNELFKLFTSVMIPTIIISTFIFFLLFVFTNLEPYSTTSFLLGIPIQFASMFVIGYYYTDGVKELINIKKKISRKGWIYIFTGITSLMVLNFISEHIIKMLDLSIGTNKMVTFVESYPESIIFVVPAMFLVVAPVEEFVFRGLIQGKAREYYTSKNAIILSGFYFGIVHILSMTTLGYGMVVYAFVAMVLGFILGYIYEVTDNLLVPIVAHGAYNSILFIVLII